MSVLDRNVLVDSPLADLHAIASELSIDGYRLLRRPELIDAITVKQGGTPAPAGADAGADADPEAVTSGGDDDESGPRRRRGRRGGRGRSTARDEDRSGDGESTPAPSVASADDREEETSKPRRARSRPRVKSPADDVDAEIAQPEVEAESAETSTKPARRGRSRARAAEPADASETTEASKSTDAAAPTGGRDRDSAGDDTVEGVVDLLANGSGFVRVTGSEPSDGDVYISSAQVKRCELVSGDTVSGPKREPRRSERFASLIRIETINGRPASEQADTVRFDDLPCALATERIKVGSEDPTLKAIEWLTPFGRGSRVTIAGGARSGKTEALRRLAAALAEADDLTVIVALAGARPEEISEWSAGSPAPAVALSFAASEDAQAAALEPVIDQARRLAVRGDHAVVLIDGLDGLSTHAARKLMCNARSIVDGGSVTLIATASAPIGGETTVVMLDASLTSIARFPALDLVASGTLRPELLVGEAGAEAIARTRAEVLEEDEG
jgi:transcription termination factor Rho